MSDQFTPGPWRTGKKKPTLIVHGPHGGRIADTFQGYPMEYRDEANARLIAAAPDLLAALLVAELASEELCQGQDPANECWVTLATIRAAIAKARGQS